MKKIIYLAVFIIMLVTFPEPGYPQTIDLTKGYSTLGQAFVYDAIKESVFLMRQEYILKDQEGKTYGRDGHSYYGASYYIGINAGNYLWTPEQIDSPWEYDQSAVITPEFEPALYKLFIRHETMQKFQSVNREKIEAEDQTTLSQFNLQSFNYDQRGLNLKTNHKSTDGWVVMAYTDTPIEADEQITVKWAIFKRNISFDDNQNFALIENFPDNLDHILGGAFVEPVFSEGQITFELTGLIQKQVLNWYVYVIPQLESPDCSFFLGWFKCWLDKRRAYRECKKQCR